MYHHSFTTDLKRSVGSEPQAISLAAKNMTIAPALTVEPNQQQREEEDTRSGCEPDHVEPVRHGGFGNEHHARKFFVADAKNRFADFFAFADWQLQFVEGDLHLRHVGLHRGTNVDEPAQRRQ